MLLGQQIMVEDFEIENLFFEVVFADRGEKPFPSSERFDYRVRRAMNHDSSLEIVCNLLQSSKLS